MKKELEMAILMQDRCTKQEAEKYLKRGTYIIAGDDTKELKGYIEDLKACYCWDGETIERLLAGEHEDRQPVEYEGKMYLIIYVN
jgi:hypothetical protein